MIRVIAVTAALVGHLVECATADEKPQSVGTVVIGTMRSSEHDRADLLADGRDDGAELREAFARLGPHGGTVRLLPGRYRLDSSTPVQVPSNTTLDGGGTAVLECSVKGQHGALQLKDTHDVVIRGVRFESSGDDSAAMFAMMNVGTGKSRDVTVRDCHFEGFTSYALRMNQPGTRFRFTHNHLRRMGRVGKGGSAINGARMIDSLIGWNFVEQCGVDAGDWAIYVSGGGARNLQVVGNTIRDCAAGIKDLGDGSDRKIIIARNLIEGITRGRSIALGGCRDVLVTGNMITMGNGSAGIGTETSIHQVVISNNIIDMNGHGSTLQPGIGIAADDSTDVSITGNQVSGGGPNASCIFVSTVQGGLIANNLLRVGSGEVKGTQAGGCGIRIGRGGTPHAWHLLVTGNLIRSSVNRNVGIALTTGKPSPDAPPKSDLQLVGNTIAGFQFAITMDRASGGRYRDVVMRGNTSTTAPLVGKTSSIDKRIVIESNTGPK
jgi:hypothetical protein